MAIQACAGPQVVFGTTGGPGEYNPQQGPSLIDQYNALMDPRSFYRYAPGGADSQAACGWFSSGGGFVTADYVPATISAVNISASASPGAGAIVLVSATGAGITVGLSITRADTGATVTGLLGIDGASGRVSYGQQGTIQLWDPTKIPGRNVRLTSGGNDSGITFTVSGYDAYFFPMTETITGANAGVASGAKAFKYISGITHTGSVAGTLTVGTGDVYGFGLRSDTFGYATIYWNSALITANTGYVAAVTTTATATTGDVRGTYATQSASDGTKRLTVFQRVSAANISTQSGVVGVTQA